MTRHLAGGRESSYVSVTDFLRFCYLNIPYLRINITLIFMSSSSDELTSKTQKKMFLLVSDSHICAPQRDTTNLGVSIQGLKNLGEKFFRISRICIIAQTWFMARLTAFFTINLLSFPRFWTFSIDWFAFLFLMAWQWKMFPRWSQNCLPLFSLFHGQGIEPIGL